MKRRLLSTARLSLPLASALAALLSAPAHAATYYWDVNGTAAGFSTVVGTWDGANAFWNTLPIGTGGVPVAATTSADDLNIVAAVTNTGTIALSGARAASSISFASGVGAVTMSGGTSLTIGGTGALSGIFKSSSSAVTISTPLILGAASVFQNNNAGNLALGALNLNGSALTVSGAGITTFDGNVANVISGAGGIIKNGTGTLNLDGGTTITHTFTGGITVNGGYVFFQNATNVSGRGNVTLNGGYLEGRFNSSPTFAGGLGTGTTAIQILGGTSGFSGQGASGQTFTIGTALSVLKWGATGENGATGFFNPTVFVATGSTNVNAKGSLNNGIDLNGTTRTITSLQTNGDGVTTTGFTISGALVNTAGTAAGLIKTGAGALILGAANTYNGSTSITGGSLILSAAAATINSTSALALSGGGTLRLVNTAQLERVANGAAITVTSGGGIDYINTSGAVVYTETLGAVTVSGGNFNVNLATAQAGAGSQTLTLGGLTQSGTGAVTFSALGTGPQATGLKNMIVVTGAGTTGADLIIGPWATTGTTAALQTDYAKYTGNFVVPAAIAASAQTAWSTDFTTGTGTLNNTLVNAAGSAVEGRLTATHNINSVKANSATNAIASVDFATNDTITVTGSTFANGDVVTLGGTAPAGLTTGQPYYVVGVSGATFSLAATSGGTKIDLTGAGTGPNITAGITLSTGNNLGTLGILNAQGSALAIGGSGTGVVTLPTTSAGNLYVTAGNGAVVSIGVPIADNTGALTLVKGGTSTLRLYSANTYTGDTIINSGTLQVGVNGQTNGANLGSGTYAGNIFIGAGASLDFQTNSNQTLSGVISGDGALLKRYIGTLTLGNANTYTGKTTIGAITNAGDPTLVVSSFNSVVGGTASSSLGAPITVANGTIELGSNNSSPNPTLRYAGAAATGEITDRVINFTFNGAATRTLDASNGSGLLKFTSAFTSNGTATGHITLAGTGAGEITQGLPFAFANFIKTGSGTWTLGGASGGTGTVTLGINAVGGSGGTLNITNGRALGTGAVSITTNTGNSSFAHLALNSATGITVANNFTTSGEGTASAGIIRNVTGDNQISGTITLGAGGGSTRISADGGTLLLSGAIAPSATARVLFLTGSANGTVSGAINNGGGANTLAGLNKEGNGTWTLSADNGFTSATTISGGTLRLAHTGAVDNSSAVNFAAASGNTLQIGTDTAFVAANMPTLGAGFTSSGTTNVVSDRATAGAGLTHALNALNIGNTQMNITKGTNVTSGTAAISFTSVLLGSATSAQSTTLNPTTADFIVVGGVTGSASAGTHTLFLGGTSTGNIIGGAITNGTRDTQSLTKSGISTWTLTGANTYNGVTSISDGTLSLGTGGSLANNGAVDLTSSSSIFNIEGITPGTEIIGAFSGVTGATVKLGANTLEFGDADPNLYAGNIEGTGGSITKAGTGVQTLSGNNTYSGSTNITAGTLLLGSDTGLGNAANVSLSNGGILSTGGFDETAGTLAVGTGNGVIDFTNATSILNFADSSGLTWTGLLQVWNWSGGPGVSSSLGNEKLNFASSSSLTVGQQADVRFYSDNGVTPIGSGGIFLSGTGELVPVPEPSALGAVGALLGFIGFRNRRSAVQQRKLEQATGATVVSVD